MKNVIFYIENLLYFFYRVIEKFMISCYKNMQIETTIMFLDFSGKCVCDTNVFIFYATTSEFLEHQSSFMHAQKYFVRGAVKRQSSRCSLQLNMRNVVMIFSSRCRSFSGNLKLICSDHARTNCCKKITILDNCVYDTCVNIEYKPFFFFYPWIFLKHWIQFIFYVRRTVTLDINYCIQKIYTCYTLIQTCISIL